MAWEQSCDGEGWWTRTVTYGNAVFSARCPECARFVKTDETADVMVEWGGLCDAYDAPEDRWWRYGEYTDDSCPKCGRQRLMQCEQVIDTQVSVERVICEKCSWEPARNDYCSEALSDR